MEQAKGKNKKTTNEKDFIVKFIEHHFPGKLYDENFDVRGVGGKDKSETSDPIFRLAEDDTNIVVCWRCITAKEIANLEKNRKHT